MARPFRRRRTRGTHPRVHGPAQQDLPAGTGGYHPHESPWMMVLPLVLLSIGAVFAGLCVHTTFVGERAGAVFWHGRDRLRRASDGRGREHPIVRQAAATFVAMLLGLTGAWIAYIRTPSLPAAVTEQFEVGYRFLLNKWYFDELYQLLFVRPAFAIGRLFWHRGDERTIDRFGPNGSAAVVAASSRLAVRFQSGYLYTYAFLMLFGLTAALTWAITR